MAVSTRTLIDEGTAALRGGDGAAARQAFEAIVADVRTGAALEGLARARYLERDFGAAVEVWEAAYKAYRDDDSVGAVRVARTLAGMYGSVMGDAAVMRGWLGRAVSLLSQSGDVVERGWVTLNRGMFEPDRNRKEALFQEALDIARRSGEAELEFATLAYLGASLVCGDRVEEGMALLDEALAAVAGREVDDVSVLQEIFCQLFFACEHAHDVDRADQWIRIGEQIAARRNMPALAAFCRTHYGGLLTVAGRWDEAEAALVDAVRLWGLGHRSLRPEALVRLAQLRLRQGRLEEAEQLLTGLDTHPEAARTLARLHLARGQVDLAADVLQRATRATEPTGTDAALLWALLVRVRVVAGQLPAAWQAAEMLDACVTDRAGPYLRATSALARGLLCRAIERSDACDAMREALVGFAQARTPMELAEARLARRWSTTSGTSWPSSACAVARRPPRTPRGRKPAGE